MCVVADVWSGTFHAAKELRKDRDGDEVLAEWPEIAQDEECRVVGGLSNKMMLSMRSSNVWLRCWPVPKSDWRRSGWKVKVFLPLRSPHQYRNVATLTLSPRVALHRKNMIDTLETFK
jgi:hypothetical protein